MRALFTRRDYDLLPEKFPAQLMGGMLVKDPSPTFGHGVFVGRIYQRLVGLVGPKLAPGPPSDVAIDDHNVFIPDALVLRDPPPFDEHYVGVPRLVVEVSSPSTAKRDRGIKARRYLRIGVDEVWIVDPAGGVIEVHDRVEVRVAKGTEEIASRTLPGFSLVPADVFAS